MEVMFIVSMGIAINIIAVISILSMLVNRVTNKEEIKELRREMDDLKAQIGTRRVDKRVTD